MHVPHRPGLIREIIHVSTQRNFFRTQETTEQLECHARPLAILNLFEGGLPVDAAANLFRQREPFDLHRGRAREIDVPQQIAAEAFEIQESVVTPRQLLDQLTGQLLTIVEAQDNDQLFSEHGSLRPDVIGRENAELFYWQAFERFLDVFRIDVLTLFGDDHIFESSEKLQMSRRIKASQIASHQPSGDDCLRGQIGIVQIVRHDGLAADNDLADSVGVGVEDLDIHAWQRLADGVRAERFEVVERDRRPRFGQSVADGYLNAEVIEELYH